MTILFYTRASPYGSLPVGGAETSLKLIAECLAARGHTIFFFSESRATVLLGFTKKTVNGVVVVTRHRFWLPLLNLYAFKKITKPIKEWYFRRTLKKHYIEIIHTYYNVEACTYLLALRELIPFKLVVRIAGMQPFERIDRRPYFREWYAKMFQESDLLNFISEGLYQRYLNTGSEIGFIPEKSACFIQDIGVKLGATPMWSPKQNTNSFRCIMVSRFTKYAKRHDILIKAISLLPKELSIEVTLIGSGPNSAHIKALITSLQLSSKVTIVEFLPQEELRALLLQADLVCHACDHEGLSKIIIESMGMGVPVLASNVVPLNTYIEDHKNGFLVENMPEAWAQKLRDVYNNKSNLESISQEAIAFVKANYNATKNVEVYEQEFQKLIK